MKKPKYNLTQKEEKRLSELIDKIKNISKQIAKLEKERSRYNIKIMVLLAKADSRECQPKKNN